MKLIRTTSLLAMLLISSLAFSQSTVEEYVREGVIQHDKGNFDAAIASYEKALKIDSKSALANYEMALSYFSKGDYKKVVQHSDVVLKQKKDYMLQAYLTKGSALDLMGKTKESIELFEKAIKDTYGHYLIHYNLALNHFKINNLEEAEKHVILAVEKNPNHASSHLMLAKIHSSKGNTVQTVLASHYFLLLEPTSARSGEAYDMLLKYFGGNVSRDPNKPNTINISLSMNGDDQFSAAELMISMLAASSSLEENKDKTEDEMFVENTESFFKVMGELKEKKNKEIWWNLYTTLFYDLAQSEHLEAYCKYITQIENEKSSTWLTENPEKITAFHTWLRTQKK